MLELNSLRFGQIELEGEESVRKHSQNPQNSFLSPAINDVIPFVKMHGLGNDFVIVNASDLPVNCDFSQLARKVANRHTGIGADQFITYEKKLNNYEMKIYNQDGSLAEACGNASRCLAKLMNKKFSEARIELEVKGRVISCEALSDDEIIVDMGVASFETPWMPSSEKIWQIAERYSLELKEIICVDIGNPHLIIFSSLSDQDKHIIGEQLQLGEFFTGGVNVNFASIKDDKIYLKVWERGTGFTLACGSGACASFAAARKLQFIESHAEVIFELGSLKMAQKGQNIIMQGQACFVAEGTFYYD